MKILVVEDDVVSRIILEKSLENWGYETVVAEDGIVAWGIYKEDNIRFVISDWMMPNMDGVELCKNIRSLNRQEYTYIILLTARAGKSNFLEGMKAGADDFITKPFDKEELEARILAGKRILEMQAHIKHLQGIIPICMHCHKIRNDKDAWEKVERYIESHSEAQFSHSLCPECMAIHYPDVIKEDEA
ncbi:MAG: hypothetical protein A2161_11645 [Candidatus Schekmanbacteria bacterium RBG_13_48_7]|uniref:Response regulatory domain-containing protein n=1 Tax=Candidatus Schekmanbacteria bacterium RBG_13_48_7 TaxID=1817878 RepID=A0A1F7S262_9BACT|nr:MAG: hypothetical protein A2161_11645 [Candidatus Schekmanbacteria bacterium RBG_13_48_7]